MRPVYAALASLTMSVHFLFLAYLTAGGFLAWRWRRTIWAHLAVVGWGIVSVTVGVTCPLTVLEDWARRRAGEPGLTTGFVDHYLTGVVYPRRDTVLVQAFVAVCVLVSWAGWYARGRTRHRTRFRTPSDSFKTGAPPAP